MAVKASITVTITEYRDTLSVTRYYKLVSATASAPSKPTANPPDGWTDTEPSYTSNSTDILYFCDLTVFSNGEWEYSTVSKSSSYEAAKGAYNKAQDVQVQIDTINKHVVIDGDTVNIVGEDGKVYASYGIASVFSGGAKTLKVDSTGIILSDGKNEVFKVLSVDSGRPYSETVSGATLKISTRFGLVTRVTALITKNNITKGMYADVNTNVGYTKEGHWFYEDGTESAYSWKIFTSTEGIRRFNTGFSTLSDWLVEGETVKMNLIEFEGTQIHPTIVQEFDYLDGITVNSGAQESGTIDVYLTGVTAGYTPVGIVGYSVENDGGSGCSYATFSKLTVGKGSYDTNSNHGTVKWRIRALGGKVTNCSLRLQILWQRL